MRPSKKHLPQPPLPNTHTHTHTNSVFAGDVRLPTEKEELKRVIQKVCRICMDVSYTVYAVSFMFTQVHLWEILIWRCLFFPPLVGSGDSLVYLLNNFYVTNLHKPSNTLTPAYIHTHIFSCYYRGLTAIAMDY